jgi:hypothetical protein
VPAFAEVAQENTGRTQTPSTDYMPAAPFTIGAGILNGNANDHWSSGLIVSLEAALNRPKGVSVSEKSHGNLNA